MNALFSCEERTGSILWSGQFSQKITNVTCDVDAHTLPICSFGPCLATGTSTITTKRR